jgi:hypothetical protein
VNQLAIYERTICLRSDSGEDQWTLPLNNNFALLGVADDKLMASFSGKVEMRRGRKPTLLCHLFTINKDPHRAGEPIARKLNYRLFIVTDFKCKPHNGSVLNVSDICAII